MCNSTSDNVVSTVNFPKSSKYQDSAANVSLNFDRIQDQLPYSGSVPVLIIPVLIEPVTHKI